MFEKEDKAAIIDQFPHYLHMGGVITKLGFRPLHSTPLYTTSPPHTTHSNPPQTFMRLRDFFLLELLKTGLVML